MNKQNTKGNSLPYSEIEDFKKSDLAQFAINNYGYEIDKNGSTKSLTRLEKIDNHSEWMVIRKNPSNQHETFYNQNNQKGTIYDLIQQKQGLKFREAHLTHYNNSVVESSKLEVSKEATTIDAAARKKYLSYEALTNTRYLQNRGIEKETLQAPQFHGRVFNKEVTTKSGAKFKNTAFPVYKFNDNNTIGTNGTHNGLELHNFNFKGAAEGSVKSGAVWISNPNADKEIERITITESPIDALSKWQLKDKKEAKNELYISTVGPVSEENTKTINRIVKNHPQAQIIDATDNDITGDRYSVQLKNAFGNNQNRITENSVNVKPIIREGLGGISIELNHGKEGAAADVKNIENAYQRAIKNSGVNAANFPISIEQNNANKTTVEIQHPNTRADWKVSNELTTKIVGAENVKSDKAFLKDWTQDSEVSKGVFKNTPDFKLEDIQRGNAPNYINPTNELNKAIKSHLQPLKLNSKAITHDMQM